MSFSALGLAPSLLEAVSARNFQAPFPIQTQAIPAIIAGRDLLALARTGSGKTASFILPLLQRLLEQQPTQERRALKALILVPTRELALQITDFAQTIANYLPLRLKIRAVYGGVAINPQMTAVNGVELLIATPGRLLDLVGRNALQLTAVETLVLDEADRLLDLGFAEELGKILSLLPQRRQNLLFAATAGDYLQALATPLLRDPLRIDLGKTSEAGQISQKIYSVTAERKGPLLRYLLKKGGWQQVLVFTSTKRRADNVAKKLVDHGLSAEALHGDRTQGARIKALADFKQGKLRVLVATDLAARGIDIEHLPYVVNYELPRAANDYTHRIGRTGRAHAAGLAVTLLAPEECDHFKMIEKKLGQQCERIATDDLELTGY